MKYCIEATDYGCIETIEFGGEKYQVKIIKEKDGFTRVSDKFSSQMRKADICDEICEKVGYLFDHSFIDVEFLELAELITE